MAKTRRAYTGGAASTTTSSVIAASGTTSFTITAYTGWPYGSDPFFVVVEPGTANEEKILVTRTGSTDTTINVYATPSVAANRGADGTSSVAHSSGVTVFPVFTALDADEANELTSAFGSKGDLVSYGSSTFETLGVGTNDQVLIADSGEASGLKWGSVDTAQLADDAVTTAKIDDGAVDTAQLAADAVTSPKISLAYADSSARATALPSPAEGDLSYLSDTDTLEVYDGSAWTGVGGGGLVFLSRTTVGSGVSSATVSGAFSSTYDNYRIVVTGVDASAITNLKLTFGATTTSYYGSQYYDKSDGAATSTDRKDNGDSLLICVTSNDDSTSTSFDVHGPNLAIRTNISGTYHSDSYTGWFGGQLVDTNQYTAFTITTGTGTITGGTIDLYGYAKA